MLDDYIFVKYVRTKICKRYFIPATLLFIYSISLSFANHCNSKEWIYINMLYDMQTLPFERSVEHQHNSY